MSGTAQFSSCGTYRYTLMRQVSSEDLFGGGRDIHGAGMVLFTMLNPSTADAERDDPTIRRCIGFARDWGFARVCVANLFAYRATKPDDMWRAHHRGVDIVGPDNDSAISRMSAEAQIVVAAWGNEAARDLERVRRVVRLIGTSKLRCLGISKIGAPWHPLYLPAHLEPMPWRGIAGPCQDA